MDSTEVGLPGITLEGSEKPADRIPERPVSAHEGARSGGRNAGQPPRLHGQGCGSDLGPISHGIRDKVPGETLLVSNANFTRQVRAPQMRAAQPSFLRQHPATVQKSLEWWILAHDYRIAHLETWLSGTYCA